MQILYLVIRLYGMLGLMLILLLVLPSSPSSRHGTTRGQGKETDEFVFNPTTQQQEQQPQKQQQQEQQQQAEEGQQRQQEQQQKQEDIGVGHAVPFVETCFHQGQQQGNVTTASHVCDPSQVLSLDELLSLERASASLEHMYEAVLHHHPTPFSSLSCTSNNNSRSLSLRVVIAPPEDDPKYSAQTVASFIYKVWEEDEQQKTDNDNDNNNCDYSSNQTNDTAKENSLPQQLEQDVASDRNSNSSGLLLLIFVSRHEAVVFLGDVISDPYVRQAIANHTEEINDLVKRGEYTMGIHKAIETVADAMLCIESKKLGGDGPNENALVDGHMPQIINGEPPLRRSRSVSGINSIFFFLVGAGASSALGLACGICCCCCCFRLKVRQQFDLIRARALQRQFQTTCCPICLEEFHPAEEEPQPPTIPGEGEEQTPLLLPQTTTPTNSTTKPRTSTCPTNTISTASFLRQFVNTSSSQEERILSESHILSGEQTPLLPPPPPSSSSSSTRKQPWRNIGLDGFPLRLLPCGHLFHESCWISWTESCSSRIIIRRHGKDKTTCPVCRRMVDVPPPSSPTHGGDSATTRRIPTTTTTTTTTITTTQREQESDDDDDTATTTDSNNNHSATATAATAQVPYGSSDPIYRAHGALSGDWGWFEELHYNSSSNDDTTTTGDNPLVEAATAEAEEAIGV